MKLLTGLSILIAVSLFTYSQTPGIVINEVMYAPVANTGKEWFELFNKLANPVNINKWKWKDSSGTYRTITNQNITIEPGSYIIICEDSNAVKGFYNINGKVLQSSGWNALNNTGDWIYLTDSVGNMIDSLAFRSSWGGNSGNKSLERLSVNAPTIQQSNWGTCIDPAGATPLRKNSISPKNYDLILNTLSFSGVLNDTISLFATVKNIGTSQALLYSVSFYYDINNDSMSSVNELINTITNNIPLISGDSLTYIQKIFVTSGYKQYIASVRFIQDEDTANNKKVAGINIIGSGTNAGNVLISEIMYDPFNECEWVELINNSDTIVNLMQWKIKDNSSGNAVIITQNNYYIQPDSFVVIAENNAIFANHPSLTVSKVIINSQLPDLNNTGDAVTIYKYNNTVSDSVFYHPSWGGNNVSLERISYNITANDSTNWASSIDCEKSTPSRLNSITVAVPGSYHDIVVNEVMYEPLTGQAEWIELYNNSSKILDLNGWSMIETGGIHKLTNDCGKLIKPSMFVIFASDTSIYSRYPYLKNIDSSYIVLILGSSIGLNNDGDIVKITDVFGNVIDSVYYFDKWHNPNFPSTVGISLEKINPSLESNRSSNWSSSTDNYGGTPGKRNSIYTKTLVSSGSVELSPNPFSPDGDGFEDFTVINYNLKSSFSQVRCKIFDIKGRLVRTLLNNTTVGQSGNIIYDGLDDEKRKLRIGIYILLLESLNDQNGVVETIKKTFVIAAKL